MAFIKRNSPIYQKPEVSRELSKCACCGAPIVASMVKLSGIDAGATSLCSSCAKRTQVDVEPEPLEENDHAQSQ